MRIYTNRFNANSVEFLPWTFIMHTAHNLLQQGYWGHTVKESKTSSTICEGQTCSFNNLLVKETPPPPQQKSAPHTHTHWSSWSPAFIDGVRLSSWTIAYWRRKKWPYPRPRTAWKVPSWWCVLRVTISLRILKPIAAAIFKIEGDGAVSSDVQFLFLSSEKKCKL